MADYGCERLRKNKVLMTEIQNTEPLESFGFIARQGSLHLIKFCRQDLQNFYGDEKM